MTTASGITATTFEEFAAAARARIEDVLDQLLPKADEAPLSVHQAIRWSVFAGGKRFRPLLLLATGEAFGAAESSLLRVAAAFEMVHTYSLIHDDLPSMDNDDLRRGKPTCHIKYGEATAILAGDALQALAFQTIAETEELPLSIRVQLIIELTRASGTPAGMVAGQAFDLEAEARNSGRGSLDTGMRREGDEELEQIHRYKTGALIIAAARCGAIMAEATLKELDTITEYASQLGLLFQITDDILDVTATAETIGKTPGKDARSSKTTYASVYGIEAARERARDAHVGACLALSQLERSTPRLFAIADFIRDRSA